MTALSQQGDSAAQQNEIHEGPQDLEILATSHGQRVNLRKVIETEILNYEQGLPTLERQQRPSGQKAAPAPKALDIKVTAALREEAPAQQVHH